MSRFIGYVEPRRRVQIMVENTRMRITRALLDSDARPVGRGLRQQVRDTVWSALATWHFVGERVNQ